MVTRMIDKMISTSYLMSYYTSYWTLPSAGMKELERNGKMVKTKGTSSLTDSDIVEVGQNCRNG